RRRVITRPPRQTSRNRSYPTHFRLTGSNDYAAVVEVWEQREFIDRHPHCTSHPGDKTLTFW
ncbi:MAG: hypothetical protein ABI619_03505, partial [Betaproteobacteria bacterium]